MAVSTNAKLCYKESSLLPGEYPRRSLVLVIKGVRGEYVMARGHSQADLMNDFGQQSGEYV